MGESPTTNAGKGRVCGVGSPSKAALCKWNSSVIITALRNPEGTLVGFAKVTQDLTLRRAAEEAERALARSSRRSAFNSSRSASWRSSATICATRWPH
jgi:hypothetical protein